MASTFHWWKDGPQPRFSLVGQIVFEFSFSKFLVSCDVQVPDSTSRMSRTTSRRHVLLIDNYDSFTYNLYQYLAELQAQVTVKRNDEISIDECAALQPDLILISPGPGYPKDAGICCDVIRAFQGKIPIAGVCLGL